MSHFLVALLPSLGDHTELQLSRRAWLTWATVPPGGQYHYYRGVENQKTTWLCLSGKTKPWNPYLFIIPRFICFRPGINACMLFQTVLYLDSLHSRFFSWCVSFPARRSGELQEEPICAEGGSRIQNKDQLQGERVRSVSTTGFLCLLSQTVGGVEMLLQLQQTLFVMGNCSAGM